MRNLLKTYPTMLNNKPSIINNQQPDKTGLGKIVISITGSTPIRALTTRSAVPEATIIAATE